MIMYDLRISMANGDTHINGYSSFHSKELLYLMASIFALATRKLKLSKASPGSKNLLPPPPPVKHQCFFTKFPFVKLSISSSKPLPLVLIRAHVQRLDRGSSSWVGTKNIEFFMDAILSIQSCISLNCFKLKE